MIGRPISRPDSVPANIRLAAPLKAELEAEARRAGMSLAVYCEELLRLRSRSVVAALLDEGEEARAESEAEARDYAYRASKGEV